LLTLVIGAAFGTPANAKGGVALLEVGRLSDGTPTNVNPATILDDLDYNEGAGGRFGVTSPSRLTSHTFTFTPPSGTSIVSARVWPRITAYGWPAMGTYSSVSSTWGTWNVGGNPGDVNINGLWAQGGGGMSVGVVASLSASAHQPSSGAGNEQTGYFYTDKLDVELNDASPPSVDQAPAGDQLFGAPEASGWYTAATRPIVLKASDSGLGVRWLLLKDGATVHKIALPGTGAGCATKDANDTAHGGDVYTVKVPCPTASATYTVNVDMTMLGDGVRSLQLGVMDGSGRATYGAAYVAKVNAPGSNASPTGDAGLPDPGSTGPGGCVYADDGVTCAAAAGGGGSGGGGGGGGSGGGGGGAGGVTAVDARVVAGPAPQASPAPAPAPAVVAPAPEPRRGNGTNASAAAALSLRVDGAPVRRVSVAYGEPVVIIGQLSGRGGTPIGGATIAVTAVSGRTSAAQRPVVTGSDGAFRAVIPAGTSRTIHFAYRAFADDAVDADTADLEIGVRAVAHLKASPRKLHNGQAVSFRGRVEGAPPGSRKVVEMQVWQDRRWLTFATTRLRNGRFGYRYRFTRTSRTTRYVFRTVVRTDAGWPYETGSSNRVSVAVRP
jgi:hypothetical protein